MDDQDLPTPKPAPGTDERRKNTEPEPEMPRQTDLPPDVSIKPARTSNWTRLIAIVLVLLFFLAIAVAAYWLFVRDKPAANKPVKPADATQLPSSPSGTDSKANPTTEHYDSAAMNLGFDYSAGWRVKESTGLITATSPNMTLTDAAGQKIAGQIIFAVYAKGQVPAEFGSGNAVAALASQKIAYSQPTDAQRASTYVSFLRYASSVPGSLDGVYVTGDLGYKVGQAIPKTDVAKADPLITITFIQCADTNCSGTPTPTAISPVMWSDDSFSAPLINLLKSLSVS